MHDPAMAALFMSLLGALRSAFRTRAELALENLALRQQLANLRHTSGRTRIHMADRAFWLVLSRLWSRWADVLVIVKPDTVVHWHRTGFRLFWRWKSRSRMPAQNDVSPEVKALIQQMAEANVTWGAPRIHGELLKLGIEISERSLSRFMPPKPRNPPSQTWRTFLDNHLGSMASIDFLTVPTATFHVLYVFLVLSHDRRRVVHWNVTSHPGAQWTAQQIVEVFPEDTAPKYMIRDRDGIFRLRHIDDPGRVPWLRDRGHNAKARALSGNAYPLRQDESLARDKGSWPRDCRRFSDSRGDSGELPSVGDSGNYPRLGIRLGIPGWLFPPALRVARVLVERLLRPRVLGGAGASVLSRGCPLGNTSARTRCPGTPSKKHSRWCTRGEL